MDTTQFCYAVQEFSNAIFLQSQIVCAQAEIEAMKAANFERKAQGMNLAYSEEEFMAVPNRYGLHYNEALKALRG